jgi:transposase
VYQDTCATRLLGLEGVVVDVAEIKGGAGRVRVATCGQIVPRCPDCGTASCSPKEHRTAWPRDLPCGGTPVRLEWCKRRWYCRDARCPRRTFTETIAQVPRGCRITGRLREAAGRAVHDSGRAVVQSGRDDGLGWPIVHRAYQQVAHSELAEEPRPVTVLGIDVTRRGKRRLRYDETSGRWHVIAEQWHTGFVDLSGDQGLLGQIEGRGPMTRSGGWNSAGSAGWRPSRPW